MLPEAHLQAFLSFFPPSLPQSCCSVFQKAVSMSLCRRPSSAICLRQPVWKLEPRCDSACTFFFAYYGSQAVKTFTWDSAYLLHLIYRLRRPSFVLLHHPLFIPATIGSHPCSQYCAIDQSRLFLIQVSKPNFLLFIFYLGNKNL